MRLLLRGARIVDPSQMIDEKMDLLIAWSRAMRDSLHAHYPPETFERRPPR